MRARIHVCYTPELLEQISRQERDDGILGRDDLVGYVGVLRKHPVFVVTVALRQLLVHENGTRWAGLAFGGEEGLDGEGGDALPPDRPFAGLLHRRLRRSEHARTRGWGKRWEQKAKMRADKP
jgi:hypothetical protein